MKVRSVYRQRRKVLLFSDLLVYGVEDGSCFHARGEVKLRGVIVQRLPDTARLRNGVALLAEGGKGFTWIAESGEEADQWYGDLRMAVRACSNSTDSEKVLAAVRSHIESVKSLKEFSMAERLTRVEGGSALTKYHARDGQAVERWVVVNEASAEISWEVVTSGLAHRRRNSLVPFVSKESTLKLAEARALLHGVKTAAFLRGHERPKHRWLCFSLVTADRTVDLAAPTVECLLDWYLVLASLVPHSVEPLMSERQLRTRIETMIEIGT